MSLTVSDDTLTAELSDGRTIAVPLAWYSRLVHATPEERVRWELHDLGRAPIRCIPLLPALAVLDPSRFPSRRRPAARRPPPAPPTRGHGPGL